MKHLFQLPLLLLALLLPASALAHDFEVDGIYYNNHQTWASVTYKGTSPSSYTNEYSGNVTIPATVTYGSATYPVVTIEYSAFSGCTALTSIIIPNSVIFIEYSAFSGCTALTSITIPNSVISIENDAFSGCSSLTSIDLPDSVTYISDNEFSGCSSLTSIDIPNSVTTIGSSAFSGCSSLTSVNIGNSVTSIGTKAFSGCSCLTSITVASGNPKYDTRNNCNAIIETASNTLIAGCQNTIIPNTVTSIGNFAFYGSSLTSIDIPNSVTTIGDCAFYGCTGLTNVTIGNSVTSIGDGAFDNCNGITDLIWNAQNCSSKGWMPSSNIERVTIGNEVEILPFRFVYGSKVSSLIIPNSVTSIGVEAFSGCSCLTSIQVANDNPTYDSRGNCNAIIETVTNTLIVGCMNTTIPNSVTTIGYSAFYGCNRLTSITIPNSVTTIGYSAFSGCSGLTGIDIPNSVTSIGYSAFSGCSSLSSITIPNSVNSIGGYAFSGCSGLSSITIPNSVTSIGSYAFSDCINLANVYSYITDPSLATIGTSIFYLNSNYYSHRTLYVPAGLLTAYRAESRWGLYFGTIVEMEPDPYVLAETIKLNVTTAGLNEGSTLQLTAMVLPEEGTSKTMNWASNNPNIATVDSNGLVTTHNVGTATITAMTTDGSNLSASCVVTLLPVGVKGDIDGNGQVNIGDVTSLIDNLLNGDY